MAVVITRPVVEIYDPNVTDGSGGLSILAAINNADPEAARLIIARPFTFMVEGTCLGDETANVANSVARLGAGFLGVLFPANSGRALRLKTWARRTAAGTEGYVEKHVYISGAATPVVKQDVTGTLAVAFGIPAAFSQTGVDYLVPRVTAEVGGAFINMENVAGTALQTPVTVAAGIRFRMEVFVDSLVNLAVI